MEEKQPSFTVTDKRKFTLEGELRDESPASEAPEEKQAAPVASAPVASAPAASEPAASAPAASEKVVTMPAPPAEQPAEELPQFSAQETAEQNAAYQQSSREIDEMLRAANPGMGAAPGVITFEHIVQSFYVSAMIAMGAATEPGQKARVDILGARQSIDMLALLEEKTKGNLTPKEAATLQNVLFELRMMFLEITNAIAQSAQRPADGKKK